MEALVIIAGAETRYSNLPLGSFAILSPAAPQVDTALASILRAADVFDTLSHPRPYQRHLGPADRARIFEQGAGTTFHPEIGALLDSMQDHAS